MKISKTLLIPIFLMIGSCCCTVFEEEIAYLNNVAEVATDMGSNLEDSMVLDEVFGSDFGIDTVCEDFYRAFKEYLSTLGQAHHMFSRNFLCIIFLQGISFLLR